LDNSLFVNINHTFINHKNYASLKILISSLLTKFVVVLDRLTLQHQTMKFLVVESQKNMNLEKDP